ncbi:MAG: double-strand break repair helicase AddA, partial [Alphaproteobacteria bacterium]|nr:double-strand break repair helicase AddA [Alphaproteobacteria bacterium]
MNTAQKPPHDATLAQIRAADPANSTWVSANAGSGKTRVLTDRVARLLLDQVPPQKILCLTYTKAAASHMQNQLFKRLGSWAMLADEELTARLVDLGKVADDLSPDILRCARTLFARALETPGGLKIQTIHSFCAALLRRFPLEAGVSPQFQEIDERNGKRLRADILENLADGDQPDAFDAMARYLSGDDPDALAREISGNRDLFTPAVDGVDIWQAFDLPEDYDEAQYLEAVLPDWAEDILPDLQAALLTGSVTDVKNAAILGGLDMSRPSLRSADILENMFVYGATTKKPNTAKTDRFPTKATRNAHPDLIEAVDALMLRFQDEKPRRQALHAARKTHALHLFAQAFLPAYDAAKQLHGWLDFDDLILKARGLLNDSTMAAWVLFKLDGGIDHILVDEAQDTSPEQWSVIAKLSEEFLTGQGAREVNRTIFVVGDEKQSIFSFQGANPAEFDRMRQHFGTRLQQAQSHLNRRELLFSFRSSAAILRLVDVILQANKGDLTGPVTHRAYHENLPGRVDIWPFLDRPEKQERAVWSDPVDTPLPDDPTLELAKNIADAIHGILDRKEVLTTPTGTRRIVAGDFLILVQRRSGIFHEIIKALKDRKLPVAGADRLKIGGELAVRDLTALLSFMATPEDDLSLAAALRSPLFRLSEQDLFTLAYGRKGYLWQEMRHQQDRFRPAFDVLNDLLGQADFLRPYELLERILTIHNGRENLIARLGHEAVDGIDALLVQAMQYEQVEPPSLTGFLGWIEKDESDIKRQMDTQSSEIRVMTVHGAKGLESAIVILPDTAKRKPPRLDEIQQVRDGLAVWKSAKADSPAMILEAMDDKQGFLEQERLRLLYVALTRAENWLIMCGAGDPGKEGESWYNLVEAGLAELGAVDVEFGGQTIRRYEPYGWSGEAVEAETGARKFAVTLPDWVMANAPNVADKPKPINPSKLGGSKIVEGTTEGQDEEQALRHGRQIHALLEHLPKVNSEDWSNIASQILQSSEDRATPDKVAALLAEVTPILESAALEPLFAPDTLAEVPIVAQIEGRPFYGIIDRLVVSENHVLVVDFKSNA